VKAIVERFQQSEVKVLLCITSKEELRSLCLQQGINNLKKYYGMLCDKFNVEKCKTNMQTEQLLDTIVLLHKQFGPKCTDEFL